jgi:hypothetical protein
MNRYILVLMLMCYNSVAVSQTWSAKGVRFGMSLSDVATTVNYSKCDFDFDKYKKDEPPAYQFNKTIAIDGRIHYDLSDARKQWHDDFNNKSKYCKKNPDWFNVLDNFTIYGFTKWSAYSYNNKLIALSHNFLPNEVSTIIDIFTRAYGNPTVTTEHKSNRFGYTVSSVVASWNFDNAEIIVYQYGSSLDHGIINIVSKDYIKAHDDEQIKYNQKASTDY